MGQPAGPPAVDVRPARVVCPFVTGGLNPGTAVALQMSGVEVTWAKLPRSSPTAYGRLFRDLWEAGESFVICEQDVVPTAAQLSEIVGCGHEWCSFNYDSDLYPPGPSFGLCRFDASVMDRWPLAAAVATVRNDRWDTQEEWWHIDSLVARDLTIRGVRWVAHDTLVHHAHAGAPSGPR